MKKLVFPIYSGAEEIIVADGRISETLLAELAAMLNLAPVSGGRPEPDAAVEMLDQAVNDDTADWRPWTGWGNFPAQMTFIPDDFRLRVVSPGEEVLQEIYRLRILRRVLYFALLRRLRHQDAVLMHGALLADANYAGGTVLFAESGMGKSTTAARYAAQGGVSVSDDRLLLIFSPDGKILARPLPTWKFFPGTKADFSLAVEVKNFLMLFRGRDDAIEVAPPENWEIALCQSLTDTLISPRQWLPPELKMPYLAKALWPMDELERLFGHFQLCGDLHGHIFRHLAEFEKKGKLQ